MNKMNLTPPKLRIILSVSMFLIVAAAVAAASLSYPFLRDRAVETSHATLDASASQNNLRALEELKERLGEDQEIVSRANSIVAESKSYQYQDQIIGDLNNYAGKAGVEITNIDFTATASTPSPSATTPPAAPAPVAPSGVKSMQATVTLKNPINYLSLLRFLRSIEQNLTKMQVSKVSLAKDASGGVSSETLAIEVYVR